MRPLRKHPPNGPRLPQRHRPHSRSLGRQIPMSPRQTHISPSRRTCILRARITPTCASQRHTSSCNPGERGTTKGLPNATSSHLPIHGFMCHFSMVRSGRSQIGRSPCGVQRHVLPHTGRKLVEHGGLGPCPGCCPHRGSHRSG